MGRGWMLNLLWRLRGMRVGSGAGMRREVLGRWHGDVPSKTNDGDVFSKTDASIRGLRYCLLSLIQASGCTTCDPIQLMLMPFLL
jgi:hypothetical protein